jgi:flavodoxin
MRVHVVYDSGFGNTELVAQRIGTVLGRTHEVTLKRVAEAHVADIAVSDVLIIGSPTQGGRATPAVERYLAHLPDAVLEGLQFAAFDTRLTARWVRMFGFAADRMHRALTDRDAVALSMAQGFAVAGKEGPLKVGELDRAAHWASDLLIPVMH